MLRNSLARLIPKRAFGMSAKLRAEEAIKELKETNPFFEKYSKKIASVQQKSPEELLAKLENVKKSENDGEQKRDYSELMQPKANIKAGNDQEKKLDDIMKVDLIKDKNAEEIKTIWLEYHKNKDVIVATIPVSIFDKMNERAKKYPIFLFPIPRSQGYEFILMQFSANSVHFTPLLCYQVHKENAPECLNMVHYSELRDKGIVLMRGEFDPKVINAQEAQCLANELQLYYCQDNVDKLKLLDTFTNQPENFKHMDVISELENLKII